jgi:hypothetical protein
VPFQTAAGLTSFVDPIASPSSAGKVLTSNGINNNPTWTAIPTPTVATNIANGSAGQIGINSTNTSARLNLTFGGAGQNGFSLLDGDNTTNATFIDFKNSSGTIIGSVSRAGGTNAVLYNTTSDYRLKEDLKEFNGLENILSIIPESDFKTVCVYGTTTKKLFVIILTDSVKFLINSIYSLVCSLSKGSF